MLARDVARMREICDCHTSCCFGFRIPLALGYVFCCFWLSFNGITFPVMSYLFWPRPVILYASCFFCLVNLGFGLAGLCNACLNSRKLFRTVLYGVAAAYVLAGFTVTLTLNLNPQDNSKILRETFKNVFDVSLYPKQAFGILQSVQILFYFYLFVAYTYCGFILQLYELKKRGSGRVR